MAWGLDLTEMEYLRDEVQFAFKEVGASRLKLWFTGSNQVTDPQFQIVTTTDERFVELPYTQLQSTTMKIIDGSDTDFRTKKRHHIYIPVKAVEELVPGGKILREDHIIEINGLLYDIEAVVPFPQQHGTSVMYKAHITQRAASEQDQGNYGA